jgi:Protein of unknown function (DUF2934)
MNLQDEIAKVAWELYEKSGFIGGRELDNWLEAERIVLARHASQELEEPEEMESTEEDGEEAESPEPVKLESQPEGSTVIEEIDAQAANAEEDIAPARGKPAKKMKRAGKHASKGEKGSSGKAGSKASAPRRKGK